MAVTIWAAIKTFSGGLMMSILPDGVVEVQLSLGLVTWIDAEDLELVTQHRWRAMRSSNTDYAVRNEGKKKVLLHRFLLNAPDGMHVDHRNHLGLDNRRANIRLCTRSENRRNTQKQKGFSSEFLGVSKRTCIRPKSWAASIKVNKKQYMRYFATELEAALWYDEMAMEHFGQFAKLNFPFNSQVKPDGVDG